MKKIGVPDMQREYNNRILHRKMLIMNCGKDMTKGIERLNQDRMRTLGKKRNDEKNLGMLEMDTNKETVMKEKKKTEYLIRTTKRLKIKFYSKNLIKVSPSCELFGTILKMDEAKTQTNGSNQKKMMTMHKALKPKNNLHRLYVSRKKRGRGHA